MAPSSTLPTTWSTAWNSRFGRPGRGWWDEVRAGVPGAVDQRVPGVAVGGDGGQPDGAVLVAEVVRFLEDRRALRPRVRDAPVDVGHRERDVEDAVAVPAVVVGQRAGRVVGARDDEPGRTRPQHVGAVVAVAGLRAGVGDQLHAEGRPVEVRGLRGVADDPHQRVPAGDGERVAGGVVLDEPDQLPELVEVELREALVVVEGLLEAHAGLLLRTSVGVACTTHRRSALRNQGRRFCSRCPPGPAEPVLSGADCTAQDVGR
jgi:hypothetical protein